MRKNGDSRARETDRVYDGLRAKILTLQLQPGAALDESRIVKEMGTSRTPVREAVIRLVSEGLLRRQGRSVRVSSFEVSQLRAFFEALTFVSRAVNRMAAVRRTGDQLKAIRERLLAFEKEVPRGDEARISAANHDFHKAIAESADSVYIQKAYEALLVESLRLARQCFAPGDDYREHLTRTIEDHREIYNAIKRNSAEEADRIATQHTQRFRERLSRQILGPSAEAASMQVSKDEAG